MRGELVKRRCGNEISCLVYSQRQLNTYFFSIVKTWFVSPLFVKIEELNISRVEEWWVSVLSGDTFLDEKSKALATGIYCLLWKNISCVAFQGEALDPAIISLRASALVNEFWKAHNLCDTGSVKDKLS